MRKLSCLKFVLLAGLLASIQTAYAQVTEELKKLADGNQPADAYSFGIAHPEHFGEPEFDLYFGIAAIDSGHAGEGVLALERYVLQKPGDAGGRAQLARGYFVIGDDARARAEFEELQKQRLTDDVRAIIDRYLSALREREANYRTVSSGYLEAGVGFDNNANSGAGSADVNVPVLGTITLLPGAVKVASWYQSLAAGGQITTPLAPGVTAFASGSIDDKINDATAAHAYDILTAGLRSGATVIKDDDLLRLTVGWSGLALDGTAYLDIPAISGEWTRKLNETQEITAVFQYAHLHYPTQEVRDSNLPTLDFSYRRAYSGRWDPVLVIGATVGEEQNSRAPNLARHIYATRADASITPIPKWVFSAGLSYQENLYEAPEPLIAAERHDHFGALDLLASYQWTEQLSIRAEILISGNHSNLGLYGYDRDVIAIKAHYDIK